MDISSILTQLQAERDKLQQAINALEGTTGKRCGPKPGGKRRIMSPEARRRIGLAMKRAWAKRKKAAA